MQPTKSEFEEICKLVEKLPDEEKSGAPKGTFRKNPAKAIALLDALCNATWPQQGQPATRLRAVMPGEPSPQTMIHYVSDANTLLELAGRGLDPPRKIYITTHGRGNSFSIDWQVTAPKPRDERTFERVVLLGKFIRDNHTSHFMRGVQSMARDLGIGLSDRRGSRNAYEDFAREGLDFILGVGVRRLNPDRDSLLLVFEDPGEVETMKGRLLDRNFHVITTGYRDGDITAKHTELATRLADRAIHDLKSSCTASRNKVILVFFSTKEKNHVYSVRANAIQEAFKRARQFKVELLDFGSDPFVDPDLGKAREKVEMFHEQLKKRLTPDVVAFFGRTDRITVEATDFVFENRLEVAIYTEIITQGTLQRLADESSRLQAVCGTDPYFHGRYALRAASHSTAERYGYAKIDPILIPKSFAIDNSIFTFDRIPGVFDGKDVNLNGSQYAWSEWMKDRCPSSYGPTIRVRK